MPKPGDAKGVQIELDPKRIGLRFPVEVGLVGDSRRVLRELLPKLSVNRTKLSGKAKREWKTGGRSCRACSAP